MTQIGSVSSVVSVKPRSLRDAEDSPQSIVELEGRLRTVEVITGYAARASGAVLGNNVHVIGRAVTLLGAFPLGERIVADLGRVVDVWLLLPDVSVNLEHIVACVTIRAEHAEPDSGSGLSRKDRSHRIPTNLRVRERVGVVDLTSLLERQVGRIVHPLPQWFSAIVEGLLTGVFRILFSRYVGHCCRIAG